MSVQTQPFEKISEAEYKHRVWAWTMYDWANSAFATTILAAVLPVYFSDVAGSSLPSAARATGIWNLGGSISFLIIALISPILGTVADIMRGKKRFLAIFAGIGIVSTALLALVGTGNWLFASILAVVGRLGFNGSITFYDSLLAHVAKEDDRDRVSARGYAMGYLGGGLLLLINVIMIQLIGFVPGAKLSFLSVAAWWAIFSIPLFRTIPEPPAIGSKISKAGNVITASFQQLWGTVKDVKRYQELFKFLVAYLIYNDGIGTIIFTAAIYGSELGFSSLELVLAILLVQFVAIPYSLIFGRLPKVGDPRKPVYLAFILFNMVALPTAGIACSRLLPNHMTGAPAPAFESTATAIGEGSYSALDTSIQYRGNWENLRISGEDLDQEVDTIYTQATEPGSQYLVNFNGQQIKITYSLGNQHGIWAVYLDGQPLLDLERGQPLTIDAYNKTLRYAVSRTFEAETPGEHQLILVNTEQKNPQSQGNSMTLGGIQVLPGIRRSNIPIILGIVFLVQLIGLGFSFLLGKPLFSRLADKIDTKSSIILSLIAYSVIAIWGFFLNSSVEFWFLAWMVATVQGGSQALSRSLYATMSPASKSGEFFGLFGIMEKFSAILGPLAFASASLIFNDSRPAVLSLVFFFIIGGIILTFVNVQKGTEVARAEDAKLYDENTPVKPG
jgi:MFS transporter, UMF1 family